MRKENALKRDGFTLIEVMIAMAVLAFGLLTLAVMQLQALQQGGAGRHTTDAASVARSSLEQVHRLPWAALTAAEGAGWTNPNWAGSSATVNNAVLLPGGAGTSTERSYSVQWRVDDVGAAPACLRDVQVQVSWTEEDRSAPKTATLATRRYAWGDPQLLTEPRYQGAGRINAGFSLIELMVAIGGMALVVFYSLGTFTLQHQTYSIIDQVSETQQNSRAIATLLERDARNAGYMVPGEAAVCGADNSTAPDTLFLSNTDAILPADQLPATLAGRDLGASVSTAVGALAAGASRTLIVDDIVIDETPSYDLDGNGSNDSDFRVGGGAILVDTANPQQGVACGVVTGIVGTTSVSVAFQTGLSGTTSAAPDFMLIPAHVWQIVPVGGAPTEVRRDGITLAKDAEDFQIALSKTTIRPTDRSMQANSGASRALPTTRPSSMAATCARCAPTWC